jgi:NitT/TauT family transport system substrate-binding protein
VTLHTGALAMAYSHALLRSLIAATLAASFFLTTAPIRAADKVVLQLNWLADGQKSAPFVGRDRGIFAKHNIDLEIKRGFGSTDTLTKLLTGAAEFGYIDFATIMTAEESMMGKTKVIMSLYSKSPHSVMTTTASGINRLVDLKGKNIATSPFSSTLLFLPPLMKKVGLDPSAVTLSKVEASTMGPLLVQGRVDGSILWSPDAAFVMPMLQKAGKTGKIVYLMEGRDADMYSLSVVATTKMIQEKPDLVKQFVAALHESHMIVRSEPDASAAALVRAEPQLDIAVMAHMTKLTNELMFNDVSDKNGFGSFSSELVKSSYDWMVAAGQVKAPRDPETFVDRSFLPKH